MRVLAATVLAATLVATGVQSAAAAQWGDSTTIVDMNPNAWTFVQGAVAVGDSTIVVSWVRVGEIFVRRSVDNGSSWETPLKLSPPNAYGNSDVASNGSFVDVVMGGANITYSRSTDGGETYSAAIPLTNEGPLNPPRIAHGPNGLVAVVWSRFSDDRKLLVRVSSDDGATWGLTQVIRERTGSSHYDVAIGEGTIYVVVGTQRGMLMRTTSDGAAWTDWRSLGATEDVGLGPRLALQAHGHDAVLSYMHSTRRGIAPVYRMTHDDGMTWSRRSRIAVPGTVTTPYFAIDDVGMRVTYARRSCAFADCPLAVFYREMTATGWNGPELVSPGPQYYAWPGAVVYTDRPHVVYMYYTSQTSGASVQVRTRQ